MDSIIIFGLCLAALVVIVASFWYLFQTVRIMWAFSSLLAIAAVIFSPLVHIVFYFIPKDGFDQYERSMFKKYFLSIAALGILGIIVSIVIPSIIGQDQAGEMTGEIDTSQPWDWDIRAENQEEVLALAAVDTNDENAERLHYEAIYQAHPDVESVMESPEFESWLQGKPAAEQDDVSRILNEGTAAEVIYVFSTFKKDLKNYRDYEYQAKRDNAQALAQRDYQEKQSRELEAIKAHNQRSQQAQYQQSQQQLSAQASLPAQGASTERQLSYDEKLERERIKALISEPVRGSKGLTASQTEQLRALEQAPAPTVRRGYNERLEYEREKARIREPVKGSNGELTRAQRDALVALETGQPILSR